MHHTLTEKVIDFVRNHKDVLAVRAYFLKVVVVEKDNNRIR